MNTFAVFAIGPDESGIVADVTGRLLEIGCNIESSQMATLGGNFSMMLTVSTDIELEALQQGLENLKPLETFAAPLQLQSGGRDPAYVIEVYAPEETGVIHEVALALTEGGVNITDLESAVAGPEDARECVMRIWVVPPPDVSKSKLEALLTATTDRWAEYGHKPILTTVREP